MSATQTDFAPNLVAAEQMYKYRLAKLTSAAVTLSLNTATATDEPIGTVQGFTNTGASGETISIREVKHGGTHIVVAGGAITAGAAIYTAASGKVQALPAGAGTYRKIGYALQAASADGSEIEAWLSPAGDTTTVTGS